jgi:hypothetical protein
MIQKPSDFKTNLFIDGSYVEAAGGRLETLNLATNEVLAEIAAGGAEDIDRAVKAAREASPTRSGPSTSSTPMRRLHPRRSPRPSTASMTSRSLICSSRAATPTSSSWPRSFERSARPRGASPIT